MSKLVQVFTEEEKAFWQCGHCENSLKNCECGNLQNTFEISKIQEIFGTKEKLPTIKFDSKLNKVVVDTDILMLWGENFYELKEIGFEISYLYATRHPGDKHTVELRRI